MWGHLPDFASSLFECEIKSFLIGEYTRDMAAVDLNRDGTFLSVS